MSRQYTEHEQATAKMILKFYNLQAGTSFKCGNDKNLSLMLNALDAFDFNTTLVKNHIREWVKDNPEKAQERAGVGIEACLDELLYEKNKEDKKLEEASKTDPPTATQAAGALDILSQTITALLAQTQIPQIEAAIMGGVEDKVRAFIREEYGTIERKITTVVDGKKVPMKGIQHERFETVLKFVANDEPVFLTGPAGSGKNVLCKQVAEALGLKFYFTNAVTQEYKLTGFTDAMGNYQPTQFYEAFTRGGVFMLDEMDASIPEVLVILNAAIANRYFDFPAPIGYVEAHPDFRVIAAGNTVGQGADYEYVGRNQLDAASLDRFTLVKIDYSEAIENSVACGDMELAQFCRDYRKAAEKAGQKVIVSYRAIGRLAKMLQILSVEEALQTCLVKGVEKDDLNIIINGIRDSKYRAALCHISAGM